MSPELQLHKERAGVYRLRGAARFQTVGELADSDFFLDGSTAVDIDLGALQSADSSAVALLLCWRRKAIQQGIQMRFLNIPEQIKPLITLYDLDDIIQ